MSWLKVLAVGSSVLSGMGLRATAFRPPPPTAVRVAAFTVGLVVVVAVAAFVRVARALALNVVLIEMAISALPDFAHGFVLCHSVLLARELEERVIYAFRSVNVTTAAAAAAVTEAKATQDLDGGGGDIDTDVPTTTAAAAATTTIDPNTRDAVRIAIATVFYATAMIGRVLGILVDENLRDRRTIEGLVVTLGTVAGGVCGHSLVAWLVRRAELRAEAGRVAASRTA
jgi:hypothetical protein